MPRLIFSLFIIYELDELFILMLCLLFI